MLGDGDFLIGGLHEGSLAVYGAICGGCFRWLPLSASWLLHDIEEVGLGISWLRCIGCIVLMLFFQSILFYCQQVLPCDGADDWLSHDCGLLGLQSLLTCFVNDDVMFSFLMIGLWLSLTLLLGNFWMWLWCSSGSTTFTILSCFCLLLYLAATLSWRICSKICWHSNHELPFNTFNIWIIKSEELRLLPFDDLVLMLSILGFRLHRFIIDQQLVLLRYINRVLLGLKYGILLMNLHDRGILLLYLLHLACSHRLRSLFARYRWVIIGNIRLVIKRWCLLNFLTLFIKALYFISSFLWCDVVLVFWSFNHFHLLLICRLLTWLGLPLQCVIVIRHAQRFKKGVVSGMFQKTCVFIFHCVLKRLANSEFV